MTALFAKVVDRLTAATPFFLALYLMPDVC
jgi:hypothetical protein